MYGVCISVEKEELISLFPFSEERIGAAEQPAELLSFTTLRAALQSKNHHALAFEDVNAPCIFINEIAYREALEEPSAFLWGLRLSEFILASHIHLKIPPLRK